MEELTEQIENAIQIYFDKSGLKENARVAIFRKQPILWEISVYTDAPLSIETMHTINGLVYLSVPFGVMHEVINKVSGGNLTEQKMVSEGVEFKASIAPVPERTTVVSVINQNGGDFERIDTTSKSIITPGKKDRNKSK